MLKLIQAQPFFVTYAKTDCTLTGKYFYEGDWKISAVECQIIIISGSSQSQPQCQLQAHSGKKLSSFSFLVLPPSSLSSFFILFLSFIFFLPLVSSPSSLFSQFPTTQHSISLTFLSPLPSVILIFPLHIFSPNIFLPPLKPHSSLFIFSLDHILFPLTTPYTHFIPQHGSNACGLQIRLYLASLLGLLLILYL